MSLMITRRRFGQLAIGSTAVAAMGYLANKTFAQTTSLLLYGVRLELGGVLAVETLNVVSGIIQDVSQNLTSGITLRRGDQLTGFTSLNDGTLVVCITPASDKGNRQDQDPESPYLIYLGTPPETVTLSGLRNKKETVLDVLGTRDGQLVGLVGKRNGRPPNKLVSIDRTTGQTRRIDTFPGNQRITKLAESADGTIYPAVVDDQGKPTLDTKELRSTEKDLNNGLNSLVGDSLNNSLFYFLASQRYEITRSVFRVNKDNNQNATLLAEGWSVNQMTKLL